MDVHEAAKHDMFENGSYLPHKEQRLLYQYRTEYCLRAVVWDWIIKYVLAYTTDICFSSVCKQVSVCDK